MKSVFKWLILIAAVYGLILAVTMYGASKDVWGAGQPDHRYDVKMKF
jgi:hypothetical protein